MGKNDKISDIIAHPSKSNEEILNTIREKVYGFVREFQKKDCFEYLYEADLQSSLAYELNKSIGSLEITMQRENKTISAKREKLCLITQEYPIKSRFDIACINPEKLEDYFNWRIDIDKGPIGDYTIFWELPLIAGIEIKYSILESKLDLSGIKRDVEKFHNYQKNYHEKRNGQDGEFTFAKDFKYLALHFFQDEILFDKCIKKEASETLFQVNNIGEFKFNNIYLISKKEFSKYRVETNN